MYALSGRTIVVFDQVIFYSSGKTSFPVEGGMLVNGIELFLLLKLISLREGS
jgi:hypothetical protein